MIVILVPPERMLRTPGKFYQRKLFIGQSTSGLIDFYSEHKQK